MIDFFFFFYYRKIKGEIELVEGVGNFVYDMFNEGQLLENVSFYVKMLRYCVFVVFILD